MTAWTGVAAALVVVVGEAAVVVGAGANAGAAAIRVEKVGPAGAPDRAGGEDVSEDAWPLACIDHTSRSSAQLTMPASMAVVDQGEAG